MEIKELDNIITLTDENGFEVKFDFLDLITYQNREYIVLLPVNDEDAGEVVILEVESLDEDNENYASVEDQNTLNEVFNIFKEKFKNEFNFIV